MKQRKKKRYDTTNEKAGGEYFEREFSAKTAASGIICKQEKEVPTV